MLDILRSLAIFSVVAETKSFSAAAKRLRLSPSVVSHHISKLEEKFDVALLYRSTRRLTLTDFGQEILEQSRQVANAGNSALELLQSDLIRPQGLLRIAAPAILEHGRFMDDVARFLLLYPNVELQLDFSDQRVDIIGSGYDLALRAGGLNDSDLKTQHITSAADLLCASPSYVKRFGEPKTPHDLINFKMIGVPSLSDVMTFKDKQNPKKVIEVRVSPAMRISTGDGALALALRGTGIARLPHLLIENTIGKDLITLLPDWTLPKFDIQAVWPKNVGRRSLTRLFVAHILEELKSTETKKRG